MQTKYMHGYAKEGMDDFFYLMNFYLSWSGLFQVEGLQPIDTFGFRWPW